MKLLFVGETPCNETGAARVNRHLLDAIVESGHEVVVLGTSHFFEDEYDHARYPYPIIAMNGPTKLETYEMERKEIEARAGSFDFLFISDDMHVPQILSEQVKKHPSIVLGAIDGPVVYPEQVNSLELADFPAVYSHYSYEQVLEHLPGIRDRFKCITLGCEPDVFHPISEEERREYRKRVFGLGDDTFLVMWANRNQMRKDPARAMQAFHLFHERVPDSRLYMHCRMQDVGGDIVAQARLLGLRVSGTPEVMFSPPDYTEIAGFDRDKYNKMLNAADVAISTSQGEGWGLTTTDFMAAGRPFIGPANTTFFELLGAREGITIYDYHEGARGYLVESGGPDLWSIYYGVDNAPRPLTSATAMAEALYYVYTHREEAAERGRAARQWARAHTWEVFKDQWKGVLAECQARLSLA